MAIAKDFPRRKKPGTLRGWLLTYNIVMLCIILALVIILFILVFSLLGEMQERNNIYQALTNIHQQLIASRELYKRYGEISSQIDYDEVLKEFKIIDREIQISLQRLKTSYEKNPKLYFLYEGTSNGMQFIRETIEKLEKINRANQDQEYYNIFYTGDKVYPYLQDYTFSRYLSQVIAADAFWMSDAQTRIRTYRLVAAILALIIAVFYLAVIYKMAMRLVRPVNKMVESAQQITAGNFEGEPIALEGPEELLYLEETLNQMRQSLRERLEMIAENTRLEKLIHTQQLERMRTTRELEKARYKALQSQINPHFLFNTLNIISRTALFEEAYNSVELINNLASIFRYTLEQHDDVTIEEELQFVRKYLTIQQFRFAERLSFSIECPPEFYPIKIPPLIIQPLVENAMIHGLEPKIEGGSIEILLYQEDKRLFIEISDSGVGINIAKLEHIQFDAKHHIGIKNISDRLKHYYHNKAELEHTRISEEGGTKVTISIPVKFKGAGNVQAAHS